MENGGNPCEPVRVARPRSALRAIGDVLDTFGDEIQGVEDLEVAGKTVEEVRAGGVGEASRGVRLGEVDHLALRGEADEYAGG